SPRSWPALRTWPEPHPLADRTAPGALETRRCGFRRSCPGAPATGRAGPAAGSLPTSERPTRPALAVGPVSHGTAFAPGPDSGDRQRRLWSRSSRPKKKLPDIKASCVSLAVAVDLVSLIG